MTNEKLSLVVLAAGIGSRYGGLKQMDPMGPNGEIILDYSVFDALRAGFDRVVFVISHAIEEAFRERIGQTIEKQCEVAYAFQSVEDIPAGFEIPPGRKKPWGTAHATLASHTAVDGPFVVINADDFYGRGAYQAVEDYLRGPKDDDKLPDYCMVGYRLGNTLTEHGHVARAICTVDEDGYLVNAVERTRIEQTPDGARFTEDGEHWEPVSRDAIVSMNMWGFTPAIYEEIAERFPKFLKQSKDNLEKAELYIPTVVADVIKDKRGRVRVLPTSERWHGVTYVADRPAVKAALQSLVDAGEYPAPLWGAPAGG